MTIPSAIASPAMTATEETPIDPVIVEDGATVAPADANAADSSPAEKIDDKQPASLLDVVKSAVAKPEPVEAPSAPVVEEPVVADPVDGAEPKAEDDADLPFHNHPRWKAVLEERNALQEPARQYGQITEFMAANDLKPEEVAEGYQIMAAIKSGDPARLAEVRDWFAGRLQFLDETLGHVLPEDLQQRVDDGVLDEEGAAEIAQTRAKAALLESQNTTREARSAEATQAEVAAATAQEMVTAITGWETATKASDPDYTKKAELIETTCRAIVQRTGVAPTTGAEAVELAKRAHAEVTERLKALAPKPRAIVPAPAGTSTTALAPPATLKEAIARAAAG